MKKSHKTKKQTLNVTIPSSDFYDDSQINVVFDTLIGSVLKGRYRIEKFVDQGKCGIVYTVVDIQAVSDDNQKPLVVKLHPTNELFEKETQILILIDEVSEALKLNEGLYWQIP